MTVTRGRPRAVLFDLYGTLVDLATNEDMASLWACLAAWCKRELGREIPPAVLHDRYLSVVGRQVRQHGYGFALQRTFAELLGPGATDEQIHGFAYAFRRHSIVRLALRDYTRPLLAALRADGIKLGIVSNTEALLTEYDIEVLGIHKLVDVIVLSSAIGVVKPDRRIVDEACAALGVTAPECIFVGDSVAADMAVARAAGLPRSILIAADQPIVEDEAVAVVPPRLDAIRDAILLEGTFR